MSLNQIHIVALSKQWTMKTNITTLQISKRLRKSFTRRFRWVEGGGRVSSIYMIKEVLNRLTVTVGGKFRRIENCLSFEVYSNDIYCFMYGLEEGSLIGPNSYRVHLDNRGIVNFHNRACHMRYNSADNCQKTPLLKFCSRIN